MSGKPSADQPRRAVWFWPALGAAVLALAFLAWSPAGRGVMDGAFDWAKGVMEEHPVLGAAVFFLFSALSPMLAFASSAVLVPPASLVWGKPVAFLLLWGGWLLGVSAAFGIGRLARPLLARTGYEDKLEKYQDYVSRRMKFWAVLLFCLAIPSEIPGYLFGSLHYPYLKFLAAIAISEAVYAAGIVVAGESLLVDKPLPFLAVVGVLAVMAVVAGLVLRAARKRRAGGMAPH